MNTVTRLFVYGQISKGTELKMTVKRREKLERLVPATCEEDK